MAYAASWWVWAPVQVVGFCLLTAALAQVRIPVPGTPVPMTLQTLAVLLAGFALPPLRAAAAMLLYMLAGWMLLLVDPGGLSFFAAFTLNPLGLTGGYLLGFLVAAPLVSLLCRHHRAGVLRITAAGIAGTAAVFLFGTLWLWQAMPGGVGSAIAVGVMPFMPQAAIKLALAVTVVVCGRRLGGWFMGRSDGYR